jgi:hypothetical protein
MLSLKTIIGVIMPARKQMLLHIHGELMAMVI